MLSFKRGPAKSQDLTKNGQLYSDSPVRCWALVRWRAMGHTPPSPVRQARRGTPAQPHQVRHHPPAHVSPAGARRGLCSPRRANHRAAHTRPAGCPETHCTTATGGAPRQCRGIWAQIWGWRRGLGRACPRDEQVFPRPTPSPAPSLPQAQQDAEERLVKFKDLSDQKELNEALKAQVAEVGPGRGGGGGVDGRQQQLREGPRISVPTLWAPLRGYNSVTFRLHWVWVQCMGFDRPRHAG